VKQAEASAARHNATTERMDSSRRKPFPSDGVRYTHIPRSWL
jgi:hypothetical protein